MQVSTSSNELATELAKGLSVQSPTTLSPQGKWSKATDMTAADLEDSDSDDEDSLTHPNKFPVEIEYHDNKYCLYKMQPTR